MLGTLVAVALGAGSPEPGLVGSVEGPFGWVDLHGAFEARVVELDPGASSAEVLAAPRSGYRGAAQLQGFAGWGLPVLGSHLAVTAAFHATLVPGPLDVARTTTVVPSPVTLGASLPLATPEVALVPMLNVSVPTEGWLGPLFLVRPALAVRWRVLEGLLVGARAGVELPLNPRLENGLIANRLPRRCDADATACELSSHYHPWAASLSVQAEYAVLPTLSVVARVDLERGATLIPTLLGATTSPDATLVMPAWTSTRVRPALELSWAIAEHLGLTASAALGVERVDDQPFTTHGWQAHLSLWFRTDPHLLRAWLER